MFDYPNDKICHFLVLTYPIRGYSSPIRVSIAGGLPKDTHQCLLGSTLRAKIGPWAGETGLSATTLAENRLPGLHGPRNRLSEQGRNGPSEQLLIKTMLAAHLSGAPEEVPTMRGLDPTAVTVNVNHLVRKDGHQAVGATDVPGRKPDNVPILRRPAVATGPF